jgi:hypothetical protein
MLNRALGAMRRWLGRVGAKRDPWERVPHHVPTTAFGKGSTRPFPWYFEGESAVRVSSVDDICQWLLECEYADDPGLFNESDFWQHPRTFEQLRRGDCEDYALWTWRKLVELGIDAELVSGIWRRPGDERTGHVWVRFRQHDGDYIFETVSRGRERMIRPLDEVRSEYIPHAGVDREFRRYAYFGFLWSEEG